MSVAGEDEWEYEYDEAETEDFYITLDLSAAPNDEDMPPWKRPGSPVQPATNNARLIQTKLRAIHAKRVQENATTDIENTEESAPVGKMQITGLHTSNPVILYNDQLLSCHWGTTLGTDLFFVKPNKDDASHDQPLLSLPSVDLLGVSSVKLMANVATFKPSAHHVAQANRPEARSFNKTKRIPKSKVAIASVEQTGTRPKSVAPVGPDSFLARLEQAKAQRRESRIRRYLTRKQNRQRAAAQTWSLYSNGARSETVENADIEDSNAEDSDLEDAYGEDADMDDADIEYADTEEAEDDA